MSVNVSVQQENGSLDAIATAERSSRSVRTRKRGSAPRRSSSMLAEFVEAEKVDAAVAGDRLRELFLVSGFDELVHQFRGHLGRCRRSQGDLVQLHGPQDAPTG